MWLVCFTAQLRRALTCECFDGVFAVNSYIIFDRCPRRSEMFSVEPGEERVQFPLQQVTAVTDLEHPYQNSGRSRRRRLKLSTLTSRTRSSQHDEWPGCINQPVLPKTNPSAMRHAPA